MSDIDQSLAPFLSCRVPKISDAVFGDDEINVSPERRHHLDLWNDPRYRVILRRRRHGDNGTPASRSFRSTHKVNRTTCSRNLSTGYNFGIHLPFKIYLNGGIN